MQVAIYSKKHLNGIRKEKIMIKEIPRKVIYTCDLCGKEFPEVAPDKMQIHTYRVPGFVHDCTQTNEVAQSITRELCPKCYGRLAQILKDNGIEFVNHRSNDGNYDNIDPKYRENIV